MFYEVRRCKVYIPRYGFSEAMKNYALEKLSKREDLRERNFFRGSF